MLKHRQPTAGTQGMDGYSLRSPEPFQSPEDQRILRDQHSQVWSAGASPLSQRNLLGPPYQVGLSFELAHVPLAFLTVLAAGFHIPVPLFSPAIALLISLLRPSLICNCPLYLLGNRLLALR